MVLAKILHATTQSAYGMLRAAKKRPFKYERELQALEARALQLNGDICAVLREAYEIQWKSPPTQETVEELFRRYLLCELPDWLFVYARWLICNKRVVVADNPIICDHLPSGM